MKYDVYVWDRNPQPAAWLNPSPLPLSVSFQTDAFSACSCQCHTASPCMLQQTPSQHKRQLLVASHLLPQSIRSKHPVWIQCIILIFLGCKWQITKLKWFLYMFQPSHLLREVAFEISHTRSLGVSWGYQKQSGLGFYTASHCHCILTLLFTKSKNPSKVSPAFN